MCLDTQFQLILNVYSEANLKLMKPIPFSLSAHEEFVFVTLHVTCICLVNTYSVAINDIIIIPLLNHLISTVNIEKLNLAIIHDLLL